MIWLTGGALAVSLVMIVGLLLLVLVEGSATFWPISIQRVQLHDGTVYLGEVTRSEWYEPTEANLEPLPEAIRAAAEAEMAAHNGLAHRRLLRTGNYELTNTHFHWVTDYEAVKTDEPKWALILERVEWGRFYGFPTAFLTRGEPIAEVPSEADAAARDAAQQELWDLFREHHGEVLELRERIRDLEEHEIGAANARKEAARLTRRAVELEYGEDSPEAAEARQTYDQIASELEAEFQRITAEIAELREQSGQYGLRLTTAQGREKDVSLGDIVRMYPANQLGLTDKLAVYASRWWEFLTADPREANTEGGVFPAIFGTVLMTLIMSIAVVPFGVLAALYLREYAKAGPMISSVRIAINNLAGVPSIVFGVFGLGFFCYGLGTFVDGGPRQLGVSPWGTGAWIAGVLIWGVALFSGVGIGTTVFAGIRSDSPLPWRLTKGLGTVVWTTAMLLGGLVLVTHTPFFDGFFRAKLPNPTFGTGGLLWASLTLALLTLPVVIVATEEALAAVPNSMREGSYACGGSKWQTIQRIVLPRAMPGIMTGTILAMARGAGEVAPLMLVGAVKLAPDLPGQINGVPPYVHIERSFMHLGFHIYDVGFQSPNSEAAKPMVFTTTLLLIVIIALLNVTAIWLRSRLRRKFVANVF